MAKKASHNLKDVAAPGGPFIPLTAELLTSAAWRTKSINCTRLLEFLMIEHLNHAGSENGQLLAPYNQLVESGIGRRFIREAIQESVDRGLLRIARGKHDGGNKTRATRYRLTFLADRHIADGGAVYFGAPTDEWRRWSECTKVNSSPATVHESALSKGEPLWCTKVNSSPAMVHEGELSNPSISAECDDAATVHEGAHPSISWMDAGDGAAAEPAQQEPDAAKPPSPPVGTTLAWRALRA
jgi:hypothetical protein